MSNNGELAAAGCLLFLLFGLIMSVLFGWVIMLLWGALASTTDSVEPISFWTAFWVGMLISFVGGMVRGSGS